MPGDHRHPARLGRRAALRLIVSTAGLSVLAACTAAPSSPAAPPTAAPQSQPKPASGQGTPPTVQATQPTPAPASGAQPKRGGTLRVGVAGDVARLDGQLYSSINTTWMSFDRLTTYDANLKPQ